MEPRILKRLAGSQQNGMMLTGKQLTAGGDLP
jgi:hypothetical protein